MVTVHRIKLISLLGVSCLAGVLVYKQVIAEQAGASARSYPASLSVASSNNFPPINMLDDKGNLEGFGRDLSDAVLAKLGIKPERRHSSTWTEVLSWLDKGEIDFIHDTGYTEDRDAYLDYTIPIIEMPEMIFVKSERLDINTFESLNGKTVACVNKHITHLYLQQFPGIKCHVVHKPVEGLYALLGGTVDAFIYPREIVMYFAQQLHVAGNVKMVGEPLRSLSWSMTVREGNQELVRILNSGIEMVRASGEFDRIYKKWFGERLLAGYSESEVKVIVITVIIVSLLTGVSVMLLFYTRRLKRASQALEQSEKKYTEIAANVPGGVFQIIQQEGKVEQVEFISEGLANCLGTSIQTLLGNIQNIESMVHVDDRLAFRETLNESIAQRQPWQIEFRFQSTTKETLWFRASSTPKEAENGQLVYNGIMLNITGLKELQEQQEHFFELSNDLFCIASFDGYFKLLNSSWEQKLGYTITELTAEPFINFVHPDDVEATLNEAGKLAERKGHTVNFENRYRCKNGEYRYLSWMSVSSPYAEEIFASAHDITDLKNAEAELRLAHNNLEQRVELRTTELLKVNEELLKAEQAMREARDEADMASRAKSEFMSRMSHELRTPLNAIIGFSQLLEVDPELQGKEQVSFANEIYRAGNHLLELINEILDLSRIESGNIQVYTEAVSMCDLLDECLGFIRPLADQQQITVKLPDWKEHVYVQGDRLRLKQVILNLLSNAVKYNVEGGSITINCDVIDEGKVQLAFSDTGIGMSEKDQENLYQPFNRLGAESSEIEGTGIGLILTKKLIELMGGQLLVKSERGKGSCFTLQLVGIDIATEQVDDIISQNGQLSEFNPTLNDKDHLVLYVEDNQANARLMQSIINTVPGIELELAETAEQGIELALARKPDLILMDINLPGMNGYQALKKIQATPQLADIPVVAVTADAMEASHKRGIEAGFLDYFIKPLDVNRLTSKLVGWLNNRHKQAANR